MNVVLLFTVSQHVLQKRRRLNAACISSIKLGNALGMRANHRTHQAAYEKFCAEYEFNLYPADDWCYVQFTQYLAWQDKVPGTCENYVSTVQVLHKLQKMPVPEKGQIHYKMLVDGLKRQDVRPVKQAEPMNHEVLLQMFPVVNLANELHTVTWTAN